MTKLNNLLIPVLITLTLGACSNSHKVSDDYIEINGKFYERNESGVVVLSRDDLDVIKNNKDIIIVDNVLPSGSIAISQEEMNLLSADEQLLEETLNDEVRKNGVYTFLVRSGSLIENLQRLSTKFSTPEDKISLNYNGHDYFIKESKILRGDSIDMIAAEILSQFPVFASIEDKKEVDE
jgi:hypothetical protein